MLSSDSRIRKTFATKQSRLRDRTPHNEHDKNFTNNLECDGKIPKRGQHDFVFTEIDTIIRHGTYREEDTIPPDLLCHTKMTLHLRQHTTTSFATRLMLSSATRCPDSLSVDPKPRTQSPAQARRSGIYKIRKPRTHARVRSTPLRSAGPAALPHRLQPRLRSPRRRPIHYRNLPQICF